MLWQKGGGKGTEAGKECFVLQNQQTNGCSQGDAQLGVSPDRSLSEPVWASQQLRARTEPLPQHLKLPSAHYNTKISSYG